MGAHMESKESDDMEYISMSIIIVVFSGLIMYGLLMLVFLLVV
ncbi:hypothetical protein [Clostridium ljungdahlii]|uniref:Uncharacterized protein n=1 Tax=Clostridium ljungdahlii TaxID=1538 RepID=A0A168PCX8_9CLOT|nr:hypothetical protein [Clostridium ljungdahlii]OAA87594.1 hypothetical protein WY13_01950 [Clostridium ljungdahlii]